MYDTGCYLPTPWRWFRTLRRQQRCADRSSRNPGDDARHQALIPARADGATQPAAGRDHQHHRQPDTAALRRDPHFFRLHVAQVAGLDHLIVMDGCGMVPPAARQSRMVCCWSPKACSMATSGQPPLTRVTPRVISASAVRRR